MEENDPIADGKTVIARAMFKYFWEILIIVWIAKVCFNCYDNYMKNKLEKEFIQKTESITKEMNDQVNYIIDFDETDINEVEYIEFDNGIKIPTLSIYTPKPTITSYFKIEEDNIITNNSDVIKIFYEIDNSESFLIEMFKTNILKNEGYVIMPQNLYKHKKIYIRDEKDGYYTYIIIEGYQITYGISYGEPKIKK